MDKLIHNINKLICRIADKDLGALDDLYLLTSRLLFAIARKYLFDKSYAEDVVSEVYYKVVKGADNFDKKQNGLNWLFKIVHNECYNINAKYMPMLELDERMKISNKDIEDGWLDTILIESAIDNLDDNEKQLIFMRYWQGLSLKEIAFSKQKPLSTINDDIKRVLKKLSKYIKK